MGYINHGCADLLFPVFSESFRVLQVLYTHTPSLCILKIRTVLLSKTWPLPFGRLMLNRIQNFRAETERIKRVLLLPPLIWRNSLPV